jgi:transcriptional regulator NrdR family protein
MDSRETSKGIWRRRECLDCLTRFTTYETLLINSMDKHLQEKYMSRSNVLEP